MSESMVRITVITFFVSEDTARLGQAITIRGRHNHPLVSVGVGSGNELVNQWAWSRPV